VYYQAGSLGANNLNVVRAVGDFAGYPDLSSGLGTAGSVLIPSTGLYLINFTARPVAPDATPSPETVNWIIRERDDGFASVQFANNEFVNAVTSTPSPYGLSLTVVWYLVAGHFVSFEFSTSYTIIQANHISLTQLSKF
jgi:hypothetical protein